MARCCPRALFVQARLSVQPSLEAGLQMHHSMLLVNVSCLTVLALRSGDGCNC